MEKLIQPKKHSVFPTVHGSRREDFPLEVDLRKDKQGAGLMKCQKEGNSLKCILKGVPSQPITLVLVMDLGWWSRSIQETTLLDSYPSAPDDGRWSQG